MNVAQLSGVCGVDVVARSDRVRPMSWGDCSKNSAAGGFGEVAVYRGRVKGQ